MTTYLLIALAVAVAAAAGAAIAAFGERARADRLAAKLRAAGDALARAERGNRLVHVAEQEDARRARVTTEVRRSTASGKHYWVLRLDGQTVATRQASPHERREAAEAEAALVAPQATLAA